MQDFTFNYVEIIGLIAATITTSAFVPQVYKTWKTKDVTGISLAMFLVMLIGVLLWLFYGISINSFSIILANILTSILILCIILMKLKYKK